MLNKEQAKRMAIDPLFHEMVDYLFQLMAKGQMFPTEVHETVQEATKVASIIYEINQKIRLSVRNDKGGIK